jgi:cyclopropane-fatty-acyl-phospholipid synthase
VAAKRTRAARAIVNRALEYARAGSTDPSHRARFDVHDPQVYERVLRKGSIGLGESYADGWWDTDNLAGFLRLALHGLQPLHDRQDRVHRALSPIIDPIARLHRADPARDVRNVRAHYDIGNEFFRRILDDTMAYSCAVFDTPTATLADASRTKFDRIARMARLAPGDRLLEIGTGWGGFALHAAEHYGCRVTTTTISKQQFEFARERVRRAGLSDRITVLEADYRNVRGPFDKVVSIEMIEAVDWREYDTFFEHVRALLTDQGSLTMQAIVVPDHSFDRLKRRTDFIKAAIFPGGCLPSVEALTSAANRSADLRLHDRADIGRHYAETLRRWRTNLDDIASELPLLGLDDRFVRLWRFYFAYCEAGFDERYISVAQLSYAASGAARLPNAARTSRTTPTTARV